VACALFFITAGFINTAGFSSRLQIIDTSIIHDTLAVIANEVKQSSKT
jgi:hypothetical protein